MQNTEWYKKTELDYDASGRWWADGYNEALSIGLSYGDDGVDVNFIDQLLVHHRKMIVKEIREEIDKVFAETGLADCDQLCDTCGDSHGKEMRRLLSRKIFSIPCLKENE